MKSSFRIQSKKVFLTYSQVKKDWDHDEVLKRLKVLVSHFSNNKIITFLIGFEKHMDGGLHYHIVLGLRNVLDSRNCRCFDLEDEHPNIVSVKNMQVFYEKIVYSSKDGNFIKSSNLNLDEINNFLNSKKSMALMDEKLLDILEKEGYHAALNYFRDNASKKMIVKNVTRVIRFLKASEHLYTRRHKLGKADYSNSDFKRLASLEKAIAERRSYWMSGPSHIGKTSKVQAELAARNIPFFVLRSSDTLQGQDIKPGDVVIADDAAIHTLFKDRDHIVQAFDTEHIRELSARYSNITLPKGVPLYVLTNEDLCAFLDRFGCRGDKAIINRLEESRVLEDLRINVNIKGDHNNVNINVISIPFAKEEPSLLSHIVTLDEDIRTR